MHSERKKKEESMHHKLNLRFKSISHQAIVSRQGTYQLIICLVYFNGVVFELKSCLHKAQGFTNCLTWNSSKLQVPQAQRKLESTVRVTCTRCWMWEIYFKIHVLLRLQEPKIVKEISRKCKASLIFLVHFLQGISPPNPLWWEDRVHVYISCKH